MYFCMNIIILIIIIKVHTEEGWRRNGGEKQNHTQSVTRKLPLSDRVGGLGGETQKGI